MPSFSINDDYQTSVFHHSIIVHHSFVGAAIVVHYFSLRSTIYFSARRLNQSNIIIEKLIKNSMTFVSQLIPSLSINDGYQTFVFRDSTIVPRTVDGAAIDIHYFSARSTIREVRLDSVKVISNLKR